MVGTTVELALGYDELRECLFQILLDTPLCKGIRGVEVAQRRRPGCSGTRMSGYFGNEPLAHLVDRDIGVRGSSQQAHDSGTGLHRLPRHDLDHIADAYATTDTNSSPNGNAGAAIEAMEEQGMAGTVPVSGLDCTVQAQQPRRRRGPAPLCAHAPSTLAGFAPPGAGRRRCRRIRYLRARRA